MKRGFRFEPAWLTQPDLKKQMLDKWPRRGTKEIQDYWKRMRKEMRWLSKGMGANLDG
jgi:hypothetical protein